MSWAARLRAVGMDTTPLRESRDFRLLFLAGTAFYLGAMVSYVAIPYQVYTLTGSNFAVGAIGLAEIGPLVVFGLYGGALADHVDRRKLLIWTGVAQAAFTSVLALNAFRDEPSVWLIFAVATLFSGVFRGTVWSQTIPEAMRGRLAGIEMLSYSLGPLGGQVRAGLTADLWTVRGAISSGGFACVAGVTMTALALRDFWSYDAQTDVHAVAERTTRAAAGES